MAPRPVLFTEATNAAHPEEKTPPLFAAATGWGSAPSCGAQRDVDAQKRVLGRHTSANLDGSVHPLILTWENTMPLYNEDHKASGPSDDEIDEMEIDELIERQEAEERGEFAP